MTGVVLMLSTVVLVALNAVFVATEFSLLSARASRMTAIGDAGRRQRAARSLLLDRERSLAVAQAGVTTCSVLLGAVVVAGGSQSLRGAFDGIGITGAGATVLAVGMVLVVVSAIHLVLGELVPRALAMSSPERALVVLAPVQQLATIVLAPVAGSARVAARAITRVTGAVRAGLGGARSSDHLAAVLGASRASGQLDASQHERLLAALSFRGLRVSDVMTSSEQLVTVPHTVTVAEAEELVHRSGHSRVLVVGSRPDEVVGFLHVKDLIALDEAAQSELLPPGTVRVALRVGPDDPLEDVLPRMRRARRHVAVVVEDGRVVGLVTLEDLLEAIVGEIRDETDGGQTGPR